MKPKHEIKPFQDDFSVALSVSDEVKKAESPKGLLVTIDATHGGFVNKNFFYYTPKNMKKSASTWTSPYRKPVLKHHRMDGRWTEGDSADPVGRVVAHKYIDQSNDRGFIQLQTLITDKEAIEKIKDGRFLTVSTSQRPTGSVTCSVCGQDLMRDGMCEHERGHKYIIEGDKEKGTKDEIKLCYYIFSDLEYKEVSFVNEPADQTPEHAATVTKWEMMDSAEAEMAPVNPEDTTKYAGTIELVSDSQLEEYLKDISDGDTEDTGDDTPAEESTDETETEGAEAPESEDTDTDAQEAEEPEETSDDQEEEPEADSEPDSTESEEEEAEDSLDEDVQAELNKVVDILKNEDLWR
jgi:hypothetical protein